METLIKLVNQKLDEYIEIKYPKTIFEAMKYTLSLKGKRLRPVMCLETAKILGGNIESALPAACAIEMLHVQSLIHDDLPCMDNDDFRRGKPSNHKVFGEAAAVLAGDALITYAIQTIIEQSKNLSDSQILNMVLEYSKAAGVYGIIGGQIVDIESEKKHFEDGKEKTLYYIHLKKTASLFRLAVKLGCIAANASADTTIELDEFALGFGLAFQIYDDIMDEISSFEEMGKTIGKDKSAQKLTYTTLYGLDNAKNKCFELIKKCHDIIDKYESNVFEEILGMVEHRLEARTN